MVRVLAVLVLASTIIYSQTYKVRGNLYDITIDTPLAYASVRIGGTNFGTAANLTGDFVLNLSRGDQKLIFSYVGYKTDSITISVPFGKILSIGLEPQPVNLPEVVVSGEDPAYAIIREAIRRKKNNREGLVNFEYDAYAKNKIYSDSVLAMVEETFIKGYNKFGEWEKEFILSVHKTENKNKRMPAMDFTITNSYFVDFSGDTLNLLQNRVYLPIADEAFDYYDYKLLKIIEDGEDVIYNIRVIPLSKLQPLLEGDITIEGKSYALTSVNLKNSAGLRFPFVNGLQISFLQSLGKYENYWLPNYVEYKTELSISISGLIGIEPMSFNKIASYSGYKINAPIPDSIEAAERTRFGGYSVDTSVAKSKPVELTRDEIDSLRLLPLTAQEVTAYTELDSTRGIETMIKTTGPMSALVKVNSERDTTESFIGNVTGTLFEYGYFRDNRVTGLVFGARYNKEIIENTFDMYTFAGYSLRREQFEGMLRLAYSFKKSFIDKIWVAGYQYSKQWQSLTPYPDILNSAFVLLGFEDNFNYYLATAFNAGIRKKFGEEFSVDLEYSSEKQDSLSEHKYQSIFAPNREVRENPSIAEGFDRRITLFLKLNKSPFELDIMPRSGFVLQADFSNSAFGSDFDYQRYRFIGQLKSKTFYGNLFVSPYIQFILDAALVTGTYGPQHLFTPVSALGIYSPIGSFKALNPYDYVGDKMAALHIEHNWRTIIWQSLGLDFITDSHLDLVTGVSLLKIWNDSRYMPEQSMGSEPYWEVYVGISRILAGLRADVAYNSQKKFVVRAAIAVMF